MTVPPFYRSQEKAVSSYDYYDIASGTGYVIFYGGWTVDKTLLSNVAFYSSDVLHSNVCPGGGTYGTMQDHDYDIEFRLPRVIKGVLIASVPEGMTLSDSAACYIRTTIYVRKVPVAGAEIEIASNVGTAYTLSIGDKRVMDAIDVTIPETHFKAGESLRITVLFEAMGGDTGGTSYVYYGHDPYDRNQDEGDSVTFSTYPSTLSFLVPFKVDL